MTRGQMSSYGADLKKGREWLKSLGQQHGDAISRFVIDLGRWNLVSESRGWSFPDPGTFVEREWRTMGRRLERKQLLPMLPKSSIFVSIEMSFRPNKFLYWRHVPWESACKLEPRFGEHHCWSLKFTLPDDQESARKEIEGTCEAKMKELDAHMYHDCYVACWLEDSLAGVERCRKIMLHAVGVKAKEVEGGDGKEKKKTLEGAMGGLQLS